tara:strand:- start:1226 stop:1411 length:186 start_codon:yes stop_codon:yes gene_type:complete
MNRERPPFNVGSGLAIVPKDESNNDPLDTFTKRGLAIVRKEEMSDHETLDTGRLRKSQRKS